MERGGRDDGADLAGIRARRETETLPSPPCRGGTGTRRSGVTSARRGRPREKGRVEKKT